MATKEEKLSPVEGFKSESNYLRGTIAAELVDGNDFFSKGSIQLLKHHGTYQQDNRDARTAGRAAGTGKAYQFMVRTKIPGGKLSSAQLLAELDLCDTLGNTTLRITTRQGLQLHGVLKSDLHRAIHRINTVQLTTFAACGDVERNVTCCPAPHHFDPVHQQMQDLADRLTAHFRPRTGAYHELWLTNPENGQQQLCGGGPAEGDVEPIYGPTYLPRKFKTAIGLPGDNCVDLYANDLGLMAICEDWRIVGYNVLVGGSFGVTPSAEKTFPAVARRLAFITPDEAVDVATAIIKIHRDFCNRSDRKLARLKYLVADWGIERFKAQVEEYYGRPLAEPHPDDVQGLDDHLGWHEQGDGRWYYGLNVENGRIKDEGPLQLKTALRKICGDYQPSIRLTAHQSMLLCGIEEHNRRTIEDILRSHGVKLSHEISNVRRWSMACPAWPTCGLAITESERILPRIIDRLEVELAKLGLSDEIFTTRMTGCPNGCARSYNSDIGLVGRTAGKYTIYLGGRLLGDRLNQVYKDLVPGEHIVDTLVPVFVYYKQERTEGETFGDFCNRKGVDDLLAWTMTLEADRDSSGE